MTGIALLLSLIFASPTEWEFAWIVATASDQQSVVAAPAFETKQVTRTVYTWRESCYRGRCTRRLVPVTTTQTVRVPVQKLPIPVNGVSK